MRILKRCAPGWLTTLNFERKLRRATPIIIYQMGKVGSSSLNWSLLKQSRGVVLHMHKFSVDHPQEQVRRVYRWAISEQRPLNVISLTREPIGRNISAFFQNFRRDTGCPFAQSKFSQEDLRRLFLSNYEHQMPLTWFDRHILRNFSIDVFATPFPKNGVDTYAHKNIRLLVMRAEMPDKEKESAVSEFLGLPDFRMQNTNIGDQKDYAGTYKAFRDSVVLPPEYIAMMCDSKYFNHFYSKETVEAVRAKWSRGEPARPRQG